MDENLLIESFNRVIISENESEPDAFNAKFIISDFSFNKNDWGIDESSFSNWKDTLVLRPLVGKIAKNKDGEDDFTGHNKKTITKIEGNQLKTYSKFDTDAFGAFSSVEVEEIDGVNYIVATAKIWKRFEKACGIIMSRVNNNEPLATSWEIVPTEVSEVIDEGRKKKLITNGYFIGHALLSKYTEPAYDCSQMLQCAEKDEEAVLANALLEDLENINNVEAEKANNINNKNSEKKGREGMNKNKNEAQTSSLNTADLRDKLVEAIYSTEGNGRWYYGVMVYPYEYVAYAKLEGRDFIADDFTKFTFTVNSDDTVSLTSQEDVKMVFIPKTQQEAEVAELTGKIEEAEKKVEDLEAQISERDKEIAEKNTDIISLNEVIQSQTNELKELEPLKVQAQEAEAQAKAQAEEAEIAELKNFVVTSGTFSEEDIELSENANLKEAINSRNVGLVESIVAQKVVADIKAKQAINPIESGAVVSSKEEEHAEVKNPLLGAITSSTNINTKGYAYDTGNPLIKILTK